MTDNNSRDIVLIGAGNLATRMGLAMVKAGMKIVQVCDRTPRRGRKLAARVGAGFIADPASVTVHAGIYILAVSDNAIGEVARLLPLKDQLVVHTSGTVEMNVLADVSENTGVFYPLQTFSAGRRIDFSKVPVCLEANTDHGRLILGELAGRLSHNVQFVTGRNRKMLHLSAVFACNFTNFMNVIAEEMLLEHEISFDLLKPLIRQTMQNAMHHDLFRFQTGPAYRGDFEVLDKHRELLADHPGYLELYNLLTSSIIQYKTAHGKL